MKIPDKAYEIIKWVALVVLPGAGALYAALAQLWGWPYVEQIPATLQTICFFLGALIGVSTAEYRRLIDE